MLFRSHQIRNVFILLFFYYPSDEYISYLMTVEELDFLDEIDCRDLFPGRDMRERIMVFVCGAEEEQGDGFIFNDYKGGQYGQDQDHKEE